ncbi:MAG: hypothetical protein M0P01_07510, partial [Treponema sp.]|nr:hypothetical protein [Treponema sp.]
MQYLRIYQRLFSLGGCVAVTKQKGKEVKRNEKLVCAAMTAVMITAAVCADGFSASGYVRAGIASTVEKNPKLTTNKWLDGIYFTGDSEKTRGRLNLSYDSTNDNGSY